MESSTGASYTKIQVHKAGHLEWGSKEKKLLKSLHSGHAAIAVWGSKPMQVKRTGDTPLRADLTSHVGLYEVKEDHFPRANADIIYQHRYGKSVLQRNDPLAITFAVRAMEVEPQRLLTPLWPP